MVKRISNDDLTEKDKEMIDEFKKSLARSCVSFIKEVGEQGSDKFKQRMMNLVLTSLIENLAVMTTASAYAASAGNRAKTLQVSNSAEKSVITALGEFMEAERGRIATFPANVSPEEADKTSKRVLEEIGLGKKPKDTMYG